MDKYILRHFKIYQESLDLAELDKSITSLKKMYKDSLYYDLKDSIYLLYVKINIKKTALYYFNNIYLKDSADLTIKQLDGIKSLLEKREDYKNTIKEIDNVKNVITSFNLILSPLADIEERLKSFASSPSEKSLNSIKDTIELLINTKTVSLSTLNLVAVFEESIKFINPIEKVSSDIDNLIDKCQSLYEETERILRQNKLSCFVKPLKNSFKFAFKYAPSIGIESNGYANLLVIHSPFVNEIRLFIYSLNNIDNLYYLDALSLLGLSEPALNDIFKTLEEDNINLYVENLSSYSGNNKNVILKELLLYSKKEHKVFVGDVCGTNEIYLSFINSASNDASFLDVSEAYLSVPDFDSFIDVLTTNNFISGPNDERINQIRETMPFIGFIGLNDVINVGIAGGDWMNKGRCISLTNFTQSVKKYAYELPTYTLLIDSGWGTIFESKLVEEGRKPFDYDDLRGFNENNIRKIVESTYSIYERAGMLVRYSLLHGDDLSIWTLLDDEERHSRIETAIIFLYKLLEIEYTPKVVFKHLTDAAGQCCDGGKVIEINKQNYGLEDMMDTICHECYHSFQHKVTHSSFHTWYQLELGLTPNRIEQWKLNFDHYIELHLDGRFYNYRLQVVEADANAFAADCLAGMGRVWNLLDFE